MFAQRLFRKSAWSLLNKLQLWRVALLAGNGVDLKLKHQELKLV